jgi:hypothetical protein
VREGGETKHCEHMCPADGGRPGKQVIGGALDWGGGKTPGPAHAYSRCQCVSLLWRCLAVCLGMEMASTGGPSVVTVDVLPAASSCMSLALLEC